MTLELIAFIVGSGHKVLCKVINILSMYMCYMSFLFCLYSSLFHMMFTYIYINVCIVEYIEQQWRMQILANFGDQHQNWVSRCYFGFYWELLTHSSLLRCHLPFLGACHCFSFGLLLFVVYYAVETADAAECCTLLWILCIAVQAPPLYKLPLLCKVV